MRTKVEIHSNVNFREQSCLSNIRHTADDRQSVADYIVWRKIRYWIWLHPTHNRLESRPENLDRTCSIFRPTRHRSNRRCAVGTYLFTMQINAAPHRNDNCVDGGARASHEEELTQRAATCFDDKTHVPFQIPLETKFTHQTPPCTFRQFSLFVDLQNNRSPTVCRLWWRYDIR